MVLIAEGRGGPGCSPLKPKHMAQIKVGDSQVHPARLSEGEEDEKQDEEGSGDEFLSDSEWVYDYEEYDDFSDLPDTRSIASDDSFYPPEDELADGAISPPAVSPAPVSLFQASSSNNALFISLMIKQGVTEQEVRETDRNNRTALMVACYQGYVDVVIALAQCPYIDVNWQDNEGNTALIMAAQAGHITITNYLLNYYPGLDLELRNCHGFTALMKAAMQGRAECVRALMLAGADLNARDNGRKLTPREWALFTSRHETANLMAQLLAQPTPVQFCESYRAEWPLLPHLVAKAREPKGCLRKLCETLRGALSFGSTGKPQPDGVLDHMVRMTTGMGSPFVATACSTVCPGSPPCVGKRRYAVQEILKKQRAEQLKGLSPERLTNNKRLFQNSTIMVVPKKKDRRASLQPQSPSEPAGDAAVALRRMSLMPLHLVRRHSVRPGIVVPKVRVIKAPAPTYKPEKVGCKGGNSSSSNNNNFLQIPKWRYKELKEERRKAEEEERKKTEALKRKLLTMAKKK
ncbi:ankyrin repeat domain-containing protein 33B [Arapaima gigas]